MENSNFICKHNGCDAHSMYGLTHCILHISIYEYFGSNENTHNLANVKYVINVCAECNKIPHYGNKNKTHCHIHKLDNMKYISKRNKCNMCNKQPNYGYDKRTYCHTHKLNDMKYIGKRQKCIKCDTRPHYGYDNETHCSKHKLDDMKYIGIRKMCVECNKRPSYGYDKITHCVQHKLDNMITTKKRKRLNDLMVSNKKIKLSYVK